MLTISFGTRTDSTIDPLTERALAMATEFMDLTGDYNSILPAAPPDMAGSRSVVKHCRLYRAASVDPYSHAITWTSAS